MNALLIILAALTALPAAAAESSFESYQRNKAIVDRHLDDARQKQRDWEQRQILWETRKQTSELRKLNEKKVKK